MADLDVIRQGDVLHLNTMDEHMTLTACTRRGSGCIDALLGVPLSEKLDFLTQLGDVLGESLNRGHFEGLEDLTECRGGPFAELENVGFDGQLPLHAPRLFDCVVPRHPQNKVCAFRPHPVLLYSTAQPPLRSDPSGHTLTRKASKFVGRTSSLCTCCNSSDSSASTLLWSYCVSLMHAEDSKMIIQFSLSLFLSPADF